MQSTVIHLARIASDHSPLLVSHKTCSDSAKKSFRFLHFWTKQPDFLETVREAWDLDFQCSPLYALTNKLKKVKSALKNWSFNSVGNIFDNLKRMEHEVQCLEELVKTDFTDSNHSALQEAKAKMILASNKVSDFWK